MRPGNSPVISLDVLHIYTDIYAERLRQTAKWGVQHRNLGTGSKTYKNQADKARQQCDAAEKNSRSNNPDDKATWASILKEEFFEALAEEDLELVKGELIQVAAVAVAIIEDIETNHSPDITDKTLVFGPVSPDLPNIIPTEEVKSGGIRS